MLTLMHRVFCVARVLLCIGRDTVSEWLRSWTRNPMGFARMGSNPIGVVFSR